MEQQQDELLALASIYGDDFHSFSSHSASITFHLEPGPVSLIIDFPPTYPSLETPAPHYSISTTWPSKKGGGMLDLSQQEKLAIQQGFNDITQSIQGQVVVFEWAERLRSFLSDRYPIAPDVPEVESVAPVSQLNEDIKEDVDASIPIPDIPLLTFSHPITDHKSIFLGHCAVVHSKQQVEDFRLKLMSNRKIAKATHNILAYRITTASGMYLKDFDDDGETAAGSRLMHLLDLLHLDNIAVCVTRWYGGIQLGPARFKHILNAARDVLEQGGHISKSK